MAGQVVLDNDRFTYEKAPILVYWEMTHACDLACLHCRAEADALRDPLKLSTQEARRLCEDIARFPGTRPPRLVLTGGDPLQRPDLFEIVAYARSLGIDVSATPAATDRLTPQTIADLKAAGVGSIALSLDGSSAQRHDAVRGVPGTFERTMQALAAAKLHRMPVQINTLVAQTTVDDLAAIHRLLSELAIERWALFFLIATGRGAMLQEISPERSESVLTWVCELVESKAQPFAIKSTEAHQLRRISYQRLHSRGIEDEDFKRSPLGRGLGVRDGNGIVFVSRRGEIFPSGFLPLNAGNVRADSLVETYESHPIFEALRDADRFRGKCGRCPYRQLCGGSRARAYAVSGDALESDPLCLYPTIRFHHEPAGVATRA